MYVVLCFVCVFFKQKTAYEMRISDWSSDVCSSDLDDPGRSSLFGGFGHHVDRDIFAAELAIVESDLAVGGCEQRVVLAHADVDARIDAGAALAHDNEIGRASGRERVCQYV